MIRESKTSFLLIWNYMVVLWCKAYLKASCRQVTKWLCLPSSNPWNDSGICQENKQSMDNWGYPKML